jgi:lipase maturation factor 1
VLVYDGECGFCAYWVRYWQKLTGESIDYRPYQEVAARYPEIPVTEFQRAVQYVRPDRTRASAAEASFTTLSHAPGKGFWLSLYRHLPGFAAIAERAYAITAAHRPGFYAISRLLWGNQFEPPRYDLVSFLFLRLFGLIYFFAFASFAVQAMGLIGSHGILPLNELVDRIGEHTGAERFYLMPMLFWWNASDAAIQGVCWAGAALSILLVFNILPRLCLPLLFVLYLSLLNGGQDFMSFQWDTYLLEAGFLAWLLSLSTLPGIWLLRWLLFRFMLMSGVVKLLSGDPNWWNLTALSYHFFTQPLPTPVAWYAAHLSPALLRFATGSMFVIELALPVLIFLPRRIRFCAGFGFLLLQSLILVTGNYNWFNLQTMLLCLLLFDDAAIGHWLPRRLVVGLQTRIPPRTPGSTVKVAVRVAACAAVFSSLVQMDVRFGGIPPQAIQAMDGLIEPLHLVSPYGLFAVMTTQRDEIIIEGSDNGVDWRPYEFRYKAGDVTRRPRWNIPHQPRLDWQMWFASLDDPRQVQWFARFLQRLLENESAVLGLLQNNPFPGKAPKFVRAQFYDYRFTDRDDQVQGRWWNRRLLGAYFPAARLRGD